MSLLNYIVAWPMLAALLLVFIPGQFRVVMRGVAIVATLLSAICAVAIFAQFQAGPGMQFQQQVWWVQKMGISYHVGVDGLNVGLVLMAAIVCFAAACCSWEIKTREKEFYILLLIMIGGILGTFVSLDLFSFYFFHELALVPTFIMIGVWGRGERRNYATFQMTLYLSIGALLALIGLVALYVQSGANTFDIPVMIEYVRAHPIPVQSQRFIFPLLLFGFGILISLWPLHSWAPLGYAAAPTPASMLHAGVLKKFGLYGLIRIAMPMLPNALQSNVQLIAWLCLGNLLYCGWVAMRQKHFNMLAAYSSVAHMGFVFLGIAAFNVIGISGAVLVMVAHGFLAALTFALCGYIYDQTGTLDMTQLGGLLRRLPFIGAVFMMAAFAGCGLPGFLNFAGEVTVLFGSWSTLRTVTVLAAWGAVVIGAIYMLRAVRGILHGPLEERFIRVQDANHWRKVPFVALVGCLLLFGCWPRWLTEKIEPSAREIIAAAQHQNVPMIIPAIVASGGVAIVKTE
jgi:NADH-quinone oxidoreductase subunit M